LGSRLALRQVASQAWSELAAAEGLSGHCETAREAWDHAATLLAVTDGPDSFRQRWLENRGSPCK
jgi:hypothetical protein